MRVWIMLGLDPGQPCSWCAVVPTVVTDQAQSEFPVQFLSPWSQQGLVTLYAVQHPQVISVQVAHTLPRVRHSIQQFTHMISFCLHGRSVRYQFHM